MPNVQTPDGKIIEFPDTMKTEEINAVLDKQYGGETSPSKQENNMSGLEKFGVGVGYGMKQAGQGALQAVLEGGEYIRNKIGMKSNKPNVDRMQAIINEDKAAFKLLSDESGAAKAGEVVGGAIPTLAMPGGAARSIVSRMATSAGQGAIIGGLQPTSEGESRGTNAIVGGGMGAAGQGVISAGGKVINAATGKVAKNAIDKLSEKTGIRTTLGEATDNPIIKKSETWLEQIPFVGLKNFRKKQNEEAQKAANNFLGKYIADPTAPDVMKGNREFASSLYENLKSVVESAKVAEKKSRWFAIDDFKNLGIAPSETRQATKTVLDRYPDIFKRFQDTKREGVLKSIIGDTNLPEGALVGPQKVSFEDLWFLRDSVGEMVGQAKKKLASGDVDRTQLSEVSKLFGAINKDIDNWAAKVKQPEVRTAIDAANNAYKQFVVKYDIVQRAYDKAAGTVGAGEMFSPKKFSTELKNIAYKDKQINKFKPEEINEMTGLANIMQVVKRAGQFHENPPTGARNSLLGLAGGAEGAAYLAGGGAMALKTAGGVLGVAGISRFLTGTSAGKSLARSASKVEPNSPKMGFIVGQIYKQLPKIAAVAATQNNTQEINQGGNLNE